MSVGKIVLIILCCLVGAVGLALSLCGGFFLIGSLSGGDSYGVLPIAGIATAVGVGLIALMAFLIRRLSRPE